MKTKYFLYVLIIVIAAGCSKLFDKQKGDLGGTTVIHGVVVLYDTLTGRYAYYGVHPIQVFIKNAADTTGYLYTTMSNSLGQYTLTGLDSTVPYIVYTMVDSSGVHYYGHIDYSIGKLHNNASDSLKLYPAQTNQNGILYHLQDSSGNNLAGTRFFVFNSRQLWANNDSLGSIYQLTSDVYGRVLKLNLPPGPYYFRAIGVYSNMMVKATDSLTLKSDSIVTRTLKVLPVQSFSAGLLHYLVDELGGPVANANVYIFNSGVLFNSADTVGYIYKLKSDSTGKCLQLNMAPGTYFTNAKIQANQLILQGKDTAQVVAGKVDTLRLVMVKK